MKTNIERNHYWIPVVLILMYFYIGELRNIVYFSSIIWLASLVVAIGFLIVLNKKTILLSYENIVWILVWIFFIVFRNENIKHKIDYGILYYAFMIIMMILIKKSTDWIDCMIKFLYFICLIHAIITIISYFIPSFYLNHIVNLVGLEYRNDVIELYNKGCMSGITSHYSINGIYLAIGTGIVCLISLLNKNMGKFQKVICPIIMILGLLLTGKRAHLVFVIITLSTIYLIYNYKKLASSTIKLFFIFLIAIIIYLIVSSFIPGILTVYDRLFNSDYSTLGGRTQLYDEAIRIFKESPLIGKGWGSYKYIVQYTVGANYSDKYSRMNTHNVYLQLLAETGISGFICFISLIIYNLIKSIKVFKFLINEKIKNNDFINKIAIMLFVQIFFILYGFTGNPLYDAVTYIPYMMSCAAVSSVRYNLSKKIF